MTEVGVWTALGARVLPYEASRLPVLARTTVLCPAGKAGQSQPAGSGLATFGDLAMNAIPAPSQEGPARGAGGHRRRKSRQRGGGDGPRAGAGIDVDRQQPDEELPTSRADVEIRREKVRFRVETSVGPLRAMLDVASAGPSGGPSAVAGTILLLVTAACFPAVLVEVAGWLRHAPALPLTIAALGVFLAIFALGAVLAFRPGRPPGPGRPSSS